MDTSPKYIQQCKDAVKIQKAWKAQTGDWVHGKGKHGETCVVCEVAEYHDPPRIWLPDSINDDCAIPYDVNEFIWLPLQDQWLNMITGRGHQKAGMLFRFMQFAEKNNCDDFSWEQFWLAFVLQEMNPT